MNGESKMKPREKKNDQNQNQKKRILPDEAEKLRAELKRRGRDPKKKKKKKPEHFKVQTSKG